MSFIISSPEKAGANSDYDMWEEVLNDEETDWEQFFMSEEPIKESKKLREKLLGKI